MEQIKLFGKLEVKCGKFKESLILYAQAMNATQKENSEGNVILYIFSLCNTFLLTQADKKNLWSDGQSLGQMSAIFCKEWWHL